MLEERGQVSVALTYKSDLFQATMKLVLLAWSDVGLSESNCRPKRLAIERRALALFSFKAMYFNSYQKIDYTLKARKGTHLSNIAASEPWTKM
ncbi:hypothetical protein E3P77_01460 [Wallemia ichthyophaga]|uniref:Uncharacterized protein n=2 Tax=Wallemia ichthyophaga TaxID=245174 RepID=A0A4T0IXJ2_WALIC|nr:uncharacterized protein J056_002583 [Wallemia ichthyophaga EXF-994]TIA73064.1 hypothetical protein E3P91_01641 [Wallemia ichthyophaga]EOQ99068.1 hypothetical protein J056_002583 [Wallemia ichthyophaga EXF-994]TIA83879.1 hypothetical protein E3P98_00478 [Wallemia ichthyophaga]TIA90370.1 hypothetical protein E3P97_02587 [Wallemia ichthyophaga]TIB01077.1 hypothetical protein E3P96_02502 [Wallemia ichthyophaga]